MIQEWRLQSFKSVKDPERVPLRALSVLAGPNSSGKSTLLQSLLLIQQTLSSKVSRRQLILNGELVKLGTFSDVLSEGSTQDEVSIGFSMSIALADAARRRQFNYPPYYFSVPYRISDAANADCSLDLTFGPTEQTPEATASKPAHLQAQLRRAQYQISLFGAVGGATDTTSEPIVQRVEIKRRPTNEVQRLLDGIENPDLLTQGRDDQSLQFSLTEAPDSAAFYRNYYHPRHPRPEELDLLAVQLDHFLPAVFVNRYATARRNIFEHIADMIEARFESPTADILANTADPFQTAVLAVLEKRAKRDSTDVKDYLRRLQRTGPRRRTRFPNDEEWLSIVSDALKELAPEHTNKVSLEYLPPPESIQILNNVVVQEFAALRYLGPLRDDPKPVYSIANSADPSHVGYKGEFTAAVLDLYGQQIVDFVHPNEPDRIRRAPLKEAVNAWLAYFEIAESYNTREEGKLGHRLFISPGGVGRPLDLTNVGVGVSQVLPIVVMALISEPSSVLLFEQPELHLHPKVQSRLADFFLAVIKTGRQCIVETHSEYLVSRLRLRVAESKPNSSLRKEIGILFVERNNGVTEFRMIEIDEYGAIPDWPRGFFDQGPTESDRILDAATKKRKQELRRRTSPSLEGHSG